MPQQPVEGEMFSLDDEPGEYDYDFDQGNSPVEESENQPEAGTQEEMTQAEEPAEADETEKEEGLSEPEVTEAVFDDIEKPQDEELVEEEPQEESEALEEMPAVRRRGRPAGSVKSRVELIEKRGRGRPKKEEKPEAEKRGRGRPAGSKNKTNSPSVKSRITTGRRGRPRKDSIADLNKRISQEEKRVKAAQASANNQINETLKNLEDNEKDVQRMKLIEEIELLKEQASNVTEDTPVEEVEALNDKMEKLLEQIEELG